MLTSVKLLEFAKSFWKPNLNSTCRRGNLTSFLSDASLTYMCKQTQETKRFLVLPISLSDLISRKYFVDLVTRINKPPFTPAMIALLHFSWAWKILKVGNLALCFRRYKLQTEFFIESPRIEKVQWWLLPWQWIMTLILTKVIYFFSIWNETTLPGNLPLCMYLN